MENNNKEEDRKYYVYVHIRLDNNTVFYVGKGKGKRAYKPKRNSFYNNVRNSCGCKVVIIKDKLTEKQAFRLESKMIKYYVFTLGYGINIEGYKDFSNKTYLTNCTWGGEGTSGRKQSEETRRKRSESMKGKNKGKKQSEEARRKIGKASKERNAGKNHPMYGKKGKDSPIYGEKNGMWGKPSPNRSKVVCITTGKKFDSQTEASKYYKCSHICDCCKGKRKYAGELNGVPLQWKYAEDDDNESKAV